MDKQQFIIKIDELYQDHGLQLTPQKPIIMDTRANGRGIKMAIEWADGSIITGRLNKDDNFVITRLHFVTEEIKEHFFKLAPKMTVLEDG